MSKNIVKVYWTIAICRRIDQKLIGHGEKINQYYFNNDDNVLPLE